MNGGISQEEYVLRRTNLLNIVNNECGKEIKRDWFYKLPEYGGMFSLSFSGCFFFFSHSSSSQGLYVPSAMIMRSNESTGYKFLVNPIRLSFVLATAPVNDKWGQFNDDPSFVQDWEKRIDSLLAIALQKGHNALVLGAWG